MRVKTLFTGGGEPHAGGCTPRNSSPSVGSVFRDCSRIPQSLAVRPNPGAQLLGRCDMSLPRCHARVCGHVALDLRPAGLSFSFCHA